PTAGPAWPEVVVALAVPDTGSAVAAFVLAFLGLAFLSAAFSVGDSADGLTSLDGALLVSALAVASVEGSESVPSCFDAVGDCLSSLTMILSCL
ncbi:MAG: hypothetical protein WED11_08385, partial [Natronospirillum sp.]